MFATTRTTTRTTTLNKRMVVQTKAGGGGTSLVPVSDRVVAFLPYLLPLISGLRYSRYFFAAFPAAIIMLQPLLPIVKIVATLPLGNLIPFFAAYLGVARNQNLSRFCRFNGMQAILLDIVLIFPGLLESLFSREILGITIPYFLSKWMYNVIWVGLVVGGRKGLVLSSGGARLTTTVQRLPEDQGYDKEFLKTIKGQPWDRMVQRDEEQDHVQVPARSPEEIPEAPPALEEAMPQANVRRTRIRKEDTEEFWMTPSVKAAGQQ